MDKKRLYMLLGDLGILLVAFLWGANNAVIRGALSGVTPLWFCALRFMTAMPFMIVLFGRRAHRAPRKTKVAGSIIGIVFICAFLVGAVALLYTTAGNQSFIISTSVVFVPLYVWVVTRKFPGYHIVVAVTLCTVGMAGMMLDKDFSVNIGDLLCIVSMLFVAAQIILVQKYARTSDPYALAFWQAFGGMAIAIVTAALFEPFPREITKGAWVAIIYTATVGFAFTLVLQTVAQKYTNATHAAILLSTSGVFGSMLGIVFLGEPMTFKIMFSSFLVLVGVLVAELVPAINAKAAENSAL